MPARKTWLLRISEIRAALVELRVPVIDRPMFERLFGVRRRRAIQLMHFFCGFQTGQAFLVDRLDLLRQLEPLEASAEYAMEQRRHQRLGESLETLQRHRRAASVAIPVHPGAMDRIVDHLPEGIRLEPGSLQVKFASAEDLLAKLFELSRAAANDYDGFRGAAEGA